MERTKIVYQVLSKILRDVIKDLLLITLHLYHRWTVELFIIKRRRNATNQRYNFPSPAYSHQKFPNIWDKKQLSLKRPLKISRDIKDHHPKSAMAVLPVTLHLHRGYSSECLAIMIYDEVGIAFSRESAMKRTRVEKRQRVRERGRDRERETERETKKEPVIRGSEVSERRHASTKWDWILTV